MGMFFVGNHLNGIMELDGQSQGNMPEWSDDYSSIWELLR